MRRSIAVTFGEFPARPRTELGIPAAARHMIAFVSLPPSVMRGRIRTAVITNIAVCRVRLCSWNNAATARPILMTSEYFSKICREELCFIKILQE